MNLKSIESHFVSGINPCVNKVPDKNEFLVIYIMKYVVFQLC